MPNNCYFNLQVTGEKQNILKFLDYFIFEDDVGEKTGRYLARTFLDNWKNKKAFLSEYGEDIKRGCVAFPGWCAWSCYSCWIEGYPNGQESVTMEELIKEFNLIVEVDSEEGGMGFEEHYIFNSEGLVVDECYDMPEFKCKKCGETTIESSFRDIEDIECWECGGEVEKIKNRVLQ